MGAPDQPYLHWCLVDTESGAERRRLAGLPGCEDAASLGLRTVRQLTLGGRALELRISATVASVPGRPPEASWLLALVALGSTAMLGALLLTVTGHSRRTERAVQDATAELRREIHERAVAEAALRESEQRLRNILDHAPIGVMFLDPLGQLIDCNAQLAQMMGQSVESLRGRLVVDLVHPEDRGRVRHMRRELRAGIESALLEPLRLRTFGNPDGLAVRAIASGLRNPQGELVRLVGVVQDITEHLRLQSSEQALARAEAANRAKSEFLSRMSHELRTPLNAMIGFAQLLGLDREPALVAHQRDWTQQIQRAGWHLLEMINDTLDLARIESGAVRLSLAPQGLPALVAACRAMVTAPAAARQVRISEAIDADAVAVLGDPTRLKQVITNLLSNAVKYNREGGSVTLTAHRVRSGGSDWIEIAVADTGLGMSPSQQAALFQPYNRLGREGTGIEGTGIGLVISRRLTELMGGTLEASSAEGQGSIFTLRLPAAAQAEQPVARYTDTSPAPYQQRLVHYVEDNETNIEVMRGVLAQRSQIKLETSTLGLDGLAAIRTHRPDLILLDMQLPDISGLELLHHLKQDDAVADIPVVVVSADATTLQTQKALTGGALHYVTKPLDVGRFLKIVDDILEGVETRWG
jgi:PAS domain S-box-containing protein